MKFNTLIDVMIHFSNQETCKAHLADLRWAGKPYCPHCGNEKIYTMKHTYKCATCRKQFSVTKGTIFENSPISLQKWFAAIWLLTSHKKGISSLQLGRDIGVTQKTAWFMLQRLRFAMRTRSFKKAMTNPVEVDETYMGGANKNKHNSKKVSGVYGRSKNAKTPVFGMLERGGNVVAMKVEETTKAVIYPIIHRAVQSGTNIYSDDFNLYKGLRANYNHASVNHTDGEYVRNNVHTNGIENFWSLMKRGNIGIYHFWSVKHLDRYIDEFEYRYNTRELKDSDRFNNFVTRTNGRLTYKELIAND